MKYAIMILVLLFLPLFDGVVAQTSINFDFFHTSLSQYGDWVNCNFGMAWRPNHVSHGWRPYMHGRWVWTDYGWYWVSREPFGWATFHYGRWYYDDYYGWLWVPDYEWGPAWVEWCYNDDYLGWAPLSPYAVFSINIGITFNSGWLTPVHYWNFIHYRHFGHSSVRDYIQSSDQNGRIIGSTRPGGSIRNVDRKIMNHGIDINDVERRTDARIKRLTIVERGRGQNERIVREQGKEKLEIYRPSTDSSPRTDQIRESGRENVIRDTERQKEMRDSQQRTDVRQGNNDKLIQRERSQRMIPDNESSRSRLNERKQPQEQRSIQQERQRNQQDKNIDNFNNRSRETRQIERPSQSREWRQPQVRERAPSAARPNVNKERGDNTRRRP